MNDATTPANDTNVFVPGEGATYSIGSDYYPVTVRRVTATRVVVTCDRTAGPGVFLPDADGEEMTFTLRKGGRWIRKGGHCGSLHKGREYGEEERTS